MYWSIVYIYTYIQIQWYSDTNIYGCSELLWLHLILHITYIKDRMFCGSPKSHYCYLLAFFLLKSRDNGLLKVACSNSQPDMVTWRLTWWFIHQQGQHQQDDRIKSESCWENAALRRNNGPWHIPPSYLSVKKCTSASKWWEWWAQMLRPHMHPHPFTVLTLSYDWVCFRLRGLVWLELNN